MMGSAALLCVASLLPTVDGIALDNDSLRTAVAAWLSDSATAEAAYGHISTWSWGGDGHVAFVLRVIIDGLRGLLTPRPTSDIGPLAGHEHVLRSRGL